MPPTDRQDRSAAQSREDFLTEQLEAQTYNAGHYLMQLRELAEEVIEASDLHEWGEAVKKARAILGN